MNSSASTIALPPYYKPWYQLPFSILMIMIIIIIIIIINNNNSNNTNNNNKNENKNSNNSNNDLNNINSLIANIIIIFSLNSCWVFSELDRILWNTQTFLSSASSLLTFHSPCNFSPCFLGLSLAEPPTTSKARNSPSLFLVAQNSSLLWNFP